MAAEEEVQLREGGKRRPRPCSASYLAVRAALYQLTRLSDFRAEKIGGGFYADVFRVTHKNTGEVMVLKMNKNRKFSRQMLSEIQLMNRLSHTNILKFKGSCVDEGQLHALTEYINGGSLEDLLHNRSIHLSWSVRVRMALDIARGMAYLHSRGVFHRDLSSRNCLIQHFPDGSMRTIVADFGLAAKIKQSRRRSHTEVVGSPYWMAPECLNGKEYCEQADVFSFGIVLAEIMARIPADPDFMPRTRRYGMDFEALKKMCLGCPQGLWEVMQRCCQIDPDDRPTFDEAVEILEHATVTEEEGEGEKEGEGEGEGDDDLRGCFSEPLLRHEDSDDNMSFTSGQSSTHFIPPITSTESLENYSANSLDSSGLHQLEFEHATATVSETEAPKFSDSSLKDTTSAVSEKSETNSASEKPPSDVGLPNSPLAPQQTVGKMSLSVSESDEEGTNKGDSGIDPGEMFVGPVVSNCEAPILGDQESRSLCSKNEKTPTKEELETEGRDGVIVAEGHTFYSVAGGGRSGDVTPLCLSPSSVTPNLPENHNRFQWVQPLAETRTTTTEASATPVLRTSSSEAMPLTTPSDSWYSPRAPSSASDISVFLPQPSTPWAPPPSPIRSNYYQLSSSLPSSPTQTSRKPFRYSMEVQEALFPPFDPSFFASPLATRVDSVKLRSNPDSPQSQAQSNNKRRSLRHSCGHSTPLPTFPEASEMNSNFFEDVWKRNSSLCMNLDQQKFSQQSIQSQGSPLRRTRSTSNPAPPPVLTQPTHYSLTLARYSPGAHNATYTATSSFKCYTIKPCQHCRLSSSEPNLSTLFSARLL